MEKFYSKQIQLKLTLIVNVFSFALIQRKYCCLSQLDSPAKFYGCTFNSTQTTFPQPPIRL